MTPSMQTLNSMKHTRHNDTQYADAKLIDTQYNYTRIVTLSKLTLLIDTQRIRKQHKDTEHNDTLHEIPQHNFIEPKNSQYIIYTQYTQQIYTQ